jgi:glycosyltransferase involved in cell wall biosynthesis
MKISILTHDLSRNCLGRAYLLAKILQRQYEVEIVGPIFGDGIWEPVANDKSIAYKPVESSGRFKSYWQIKALFRRITGDVIYASKPLFSSYDVALLKKYFSKRPLVLDIDDWQLGFLEVRENRIRSTTGLRRLKMLKGSMKRFLLKPDNSYWWVKFNEWLVRFANEVTVSNNFLKTRFGGTIVWHARDTTAFNPDNFDKSSIRKKYGLGQDEKAVIFCGTPTPYKGIEDLITALKEIPDVKLIIAGLKERQYCRKIVAKAKSELGEKRIMPFGLQPFSLIPEFLAMSDIVAIPQKNTSHTIGQMPAKVFDAMAMAKPIVASSTCDLPEVLSGCGWIVEPGKPKELTSAIRHIFDNIEEGKRKGWQARKRCEVKYSYNAMEKSLHKLFHKYE